MLIVVSYDVPSDRRRAKLAKALLDFGRRVQLSVFECNLEAAGIERLRRRVVGLIAEREDSVRIYTLCGTCRERVKCLGLGVVPEADPKVYIL